MTALITLDDIKEFTEISDNVDVLKKLKPYIHQAQIFDLKPAIGYSFYHDMVQNISDTKYQELLNGKTYENGQGLTVSFEGLRPAIVYWAYSRYKENSGVHDTAYGSMMKRNEYSDPVSEKSIARIVGNARSAAKGYLDDVLRFLYVKSADYPLWISQGCGQSSPSGSIVISAVGPEIYPSGGYLDEERFHTPKLT